jgi:hypothetical protein
VLALAYLQLAQRFGGWQLTDAPLLLWAIGGLTAGGYAVLLSILRALRPKTRPLRSLVALELCAALFLVFAFGRWPWPLSLIAVIGLIAVRALGTVAVVDSVG